MSSQALAYAWHLIDEHPDLTAYDALTLLALADWSNTDAKECARKGMPVGGSWPSIAVIAKKARVGHATVERSFAVLKDLIPHRIRVKQSTVWIFPVKFLVRSSLTEREDDCPHIPQSEGSTTEELSPHPSERGTHPSQGGVTSLTQRDNPVIDPELKIPRGAKSRLCVVCVKRLPTDQERINGIHNACIDTFQSIQFDRAAGG